MNNMEIKPCECGAEPYFYEDYSSDSNEYYYSICCLNEKCPHYKPATKSAWDAKFLDTGWLDSEQETIDLWNRMVVNE